MWYCGNGVMCMCVCVCEKSQYQCVNSNIISLASNGVCNVYILIIISLIISS